MTAALTSAVDTLLRFAAAMLRAGNTASRTREWMEILVRKMGLAGLSAGFTFDSITVTVHGPEQQTTALIEIGPPGVNVGRIADLERLAAAAGPSYTPLEITARIAEIQSAPPLFSRLQIVAGIGGALGQWSRFRLIDRHFNPYGVAALATLVASASYVAAAALAAHVGFGFFGLGFANYPAGFIAFTAGPAARAR